VQGFTADCSSRGLRQEVTFMVQDDGPVGPDGVRGCFDDQRVVSETGVMLIRRSRSASASKRSRWGSCGCVVTGPAPPTPGAR